MTATSVRDVGSVMNQGVRAGGAAVKAGTNAFQTVWDSQAGANKAPQQNQTPEKSDSADRKAKPGDGLRAKEHSRKDIREDEAGKTQTGRAAKNQDTQDAQDGIAIGAMSEDELLGVMEAVATSAMTLIGQIADTFGISVESVQELMVGLDLQPADLLQPENLSNLLLAAGGAQDNLSLLTDEQLCSDYQMLMEQGREALETVADEVEMSPQQLLQTAEEARTVPVQAEDKRVAEIPEDEKNDLPVLTVDAGEGESGSAETVQNTQQSTDGRNEKDTKQDNDRSFGDSSGNLTVQNLRTDAFQPHTEAVQEPTSPWDVDTQDMMRQILDYMKFQVKADVSSLEMQLHPASLGTLQIHVAAKGGVLTANFISQNEAVKAALESQMVQLKESFEEQGVKVEAIEVTVQTHQFEQNLEQGRQGQSRETAEGKRPRTRRITLGGESGVEIPGELESDDRIAAEMMAANGGTVDFTA